MAGIFVAGGACHVLADPGYGLVRALGTRRLNYSLFSLQESKRQLLQNVGHDLYPPNTANRKYCQGFMPKTSGVFPT